MGILKGFSRLTVGFDVQDGLLCESLSFENCRYISAVNFIVVWKLLASSIKSSSSFLLQSHKGENIIVTLPFSWLGVTLLD